MDSLKSQVLHGLKWSFMAKLITQLFSWVSTFMVLRLLTPDDYGIVAIAMIFFSFIIMFTNNGLISALVRLQKVDSEASSQIFTLSLLINLSASIFLVVMAEPIAQWYSTPELIDVLIILALFNPLNSFIVVPQAKLQIDMKFKQKSIVEGVSGGAAAVTALACALLGMEYWSLIIANIVLFSVKVVGINIVAKIKYGVTFRWRGSADLFKFAMHVQLGGFIWFIYNKADTVIIARVLGVDKAGLYNVASDVASIPMSKINAIMSEVAFSAFAKTKDIKSAADHYLSKSLRLMGAVTFPVFYGIAAVSDQVVSLLIGDKWKEAAVVISILCLVFPFRMLNSVMGNYAIGMGETKFGVNNAIITALVVIPSLLVGAQYDLIGVSISWVLAFFVVYIILLIRFRNKFSLPMQKLLSYWKVVLPSVAMLLVVQFTPFDELFTGGDFILLLVKIVTGALVVSPFLFSIYYEEFRNLFKKEI